MSEAALPGRLGAAAFLRLHSDDRLRRRAAGGDERAFAAIFDRYHQPLFRFCMTIVGDAEDAQDALQNTMVKVMRGLPGERREIDLKPWLYRIAHNESIDLVRRRRETRKLDTEAPAPGGDLAEEAATRERLRLLLADLEQLPERQRETLVMRELAGLDFERIGAVVGTSAAGARQTVYEARKGLRQMAEGREMSCEKVTEALSDGDGRVIRRRDVRAHLRSCAECRRFGEELRERRRDLAAIAPLPAVAATGILHGLLGGSGSSGGGGLLGLLGGGAAKSIGTSAALKGAATVAVVAVGVTAADRGGLVDLGLPGGRGGFEPATKADADGSGGAPAAGAGGDEARAAASVPDAKERSRRGGAGSPGSAPGLRQATKGGKGVSDQHAGGREVAAGKPGSTGARHADRSAPGREIAAKARGGERGRSAEAKAGRTRKPQAKGSGGSRNASSHKASGNGSGGSGSQSQHGKPATVPSKPATSGAAGGDGGPGPPAAAAAPENPAPRTPGGGKRHAPAAAVDPHGPPGGSSATPGSEDGE